MKTIRSATIALMIFSAIGVAANTEAETQKSGIELGMQAWTFNRDTFVDAIGKTSALGVRYLQAYPRQTLGGGLDGKFEPSMDEATRAKLLALLKEKNVELVSFGIVRAEDEAGWRELFAFAKSMGIPNLTCEPKADVLPLLDKLSKEYGITVSIHNHGANVAERLEQLKPYGPNMGLCADTGHWVRNGQEAVEGLRLAEGRIHSLHLKDMSGKTKESHCVPFGKGVSDYSGQIAELQRQNFRGIAFIEYEYRTPALDGDVRECVETFRGQALAAP
ncbi:MAG TPA: sugar phosphate isomerase/epimerase family protein [Terrimicrobiaceae bacterium]|nr:sugar phosphate isomerase/epimerase family protein [Terrimicrobiaceae bacterium]